MFVGCSKGQRRRSALTTGASTHHDRNPSTSARATRRDAGFERRVDAFESTDLAHGKGFNICSFALEQRQPRSDLFTKTQAFFGGLHDWVGDVPPTKQDVAKAALVAFGAMHVKAIRKTGGEILGNVPLTESQSEIPELMDSHGGPAARILKGAKFQRAARRDEWGKVPVLSFWGYDVIKLIAESRFANPAA